MGSVGHGRSQVHLIQSGGGFGRCRAADPQFRPLGWLSTVGFIGISGCYLAPFPLRSATPGCFRGRAGGGDGEGPSELEPKRVFRAAQKADRALQPPGTGGCRSRSPGGAGAGRIGAPFRLKFPRWRRSDRPLMPAGRRRGAFGVRFA